MLAAGTALLLYAGGLAWLSRRTASASIDVDTAAYWLVSCSVPAGLLYVCALWPTARKQPSKWTIVWIITVGVAMRAVIMVAPPSLEDDYFRYLWDGAVTAHGLNPYQHSPAQVLAAEPATPVAPEIIELRTQAGPILHRVNHPNVTTIYPPIAQLAFAAAYVITPFSTDSWRLVLFICDGVTLVLLLRMMSLVGIPLAAVAWYWWNPILLREIYGGAHMDVLMLPFVLGAVVFAAKERFHRSMLLLAAAGLVKIWPLVLAPVLLRPLLATPKRLCLAITVLVATTAAFWTPFIPDMLDQNSGLLAYATGWEYNAGAFAFIEELYRQLLAFMGDHYQEWAHPTARATVTVSIVAWLVWLIRRPVINGNDLVRRCSWLIAAVFLLSPAQFPWYYVWVVPFLAMAPRVSLLSYSFLLPLYYVHRNHAELIWLEHGLVWIMLAREWAADVIRRRRLRARDSTALALQGFGNV